jgi:hypothetical protein
MVHSLLLKWYRCDHQRLLDLAFFIAVPAVLTATMSLAGPYVDLLGVRGGVLYVAALSFIPWWITGLATSLAFAGLRPFRPPLWVLTLIGALAASAVLVPAIHALNGGFRAFWPGGYLLHELSWPLTVDRMRELITSAGRAVVLWTAFVYVFATTLGWSRYRYAPQADRPKGTLTPSRFENSGRPWTAENDLELARHIGAGLTPGEIARRMHRTVAAIRVRITKLNSDARGR